MGYYENVNGDLELRAGSTLYADAPIGAIEAYGGTSAPSGWMICNGTAISRSTYAELFAVIGTAFGAGDGSTTFNIPDLRESVPKGAGLTGHTVGAHLDADGLAVGEFLDDRAQNFLLNGNVNTTGDNGARFTYGALSSSIIPNRLSSLSSDARTGDTTEVKSVGVNYIIKAKQTALPKDLETAVDTKIAADKVSSIASGNTKSVTSGAVYSGLTDFVKVVDAVGTITLEANSQKQVSLSFTCPAGYKAVLATPKSAGSWAFVWAFCYLVSQSSVYAVIKSCLGTDETQTIYATVLCVKTSF